MPAIVFETQEGGCINQSIPNCWVTIWNKNGMVHKSGKSVQMYKRDVTANALVLYSLSSEKVYHM